MDFEQIRETNRAASVAMVTALGFDPKDVLDHRGDGSLDMKGNTVVLRIIEWERPGVPRREHGEIAYSEHRIEATPEHQAAYRAAHQASHGRSLGGM